MATPVKTASSPSTSFDSRPDRGWAASHWVTLFIVLLATRALILAAFQFHWPILGPFAHGSVATDFTGDFWAVARNIVNGLGFSTKLDDFTRDPIPHPTAFYSPGQPYFYAALLRFAPVHYFLVAKAIQSFLICVSFLLYTIYFEKAFGKRVAVLSYVLMATSPILGIVPLTYQDTNSTLLLAAIVLLCLDRLYHHPSDKSALLLGIFFGALVSFNPSYGAVGIVAFLWLLFRVRVGWRPVLITAFTAALVLAPWAYRNYRLFHRFIPVRSAYKAIFWHGNNPKATGGHYATDFKSRNAPDDAMINDMTGMNEIEMEDYLYKKGKEFVHANPGRFVQLRLNAWLYFWTTQEYWVHPPRTFARRLLFGYNLLMVGTAFFGMFLAWRDGVPQAGFLALGLIAFGFVYSLALAELYARYRETLDPLLLGFSAYTLWQCADFIAARRKSREPLPSR